MKRFFLSKRVDSVEKLLQDFVVELEKIPEVKLVEKFQNWKQIVSDYFTIIGLIIMIITGVSSYLFQTYKEILIAIFGVVLAVWLGRFVINRKQ